MPKVGSHLATRVVVAVLEVMWDWRAKTSRAGYAERAPEWYRINPTNFTGRRLYSWLGDQGEYFDDLKVTNACPELVTSAKGRGKPDQVWLLNNLSDLQPFDLLLVCGAVAQATYSEETSWYTRGRERVIYLPHPAARGWTNGGLELAGKTIREGSGDATLKIS